MKIATFGTGVALSEQMNPKMKKLIVLLVLVSGLFLTAYSQGPVSKDNYTGDWEVAGSWDVGPTPPGNLTGAHLNLNINGYITRNGSLSVGFNSGDGGKKFIVNDTLVVLGNLSFDQNAAELVIGPNAVLIVIGDFSVSNNHVLTNNGIFVVSGSMNFPGNGSETYQGTGEVYSPSPVTGNATADGANEWDQLDDRYPVIHEFVLCRTTNPSGACRLPIKLSYFAAELQNDVVELRWATTMEENFQKFIVQRLSNGVAFEDLGEVAGKGFDIYDIESKYFFEDRNPLTGFNYYRLKAVDLDDSFEYFGVKAVKISAPKKMTVYPNPSSGESIIFRSNFHTRESDRIVLINQLGTELLNVAASGVLPGISFPERLRPGIYMLRYVSDDFEQTTRIVVKN